ncbi:MAG: hypothetical protein SGBAC_007321 [Bacillariaceae sp.]
MSELDVLIVGAGASGLTAAYVLQAAHQNVRILEANSILGGRLQKDTSLGGWPIDIGGEWIHLETEDDSNKNKNNNNNNNNNNPEALFQKIYGKDFRLDDMPTVLDPQEMSYYITDENKIYKERLADVTDFRWKNGTWWDFLDQKVAAATLKKSDNAIVYDCVVNEIDYSDNAKSTATATCANGDTYTAKHVIVTASMAVLQSGDIRFVPELPQKYKTVMNDNFDMRPGLKAFLEFSEQFYGESNVFVDTDLDWYELDDMSDPLFGARMFYDQTFGKDTNLNIMGFFAYATAAEYYVSKGKDFVIDDILSELDGMYNGKASATFKRGIVQDWTAQPYAKTAYCNHVKDAQTTINTFKTPINGKVYFAGEALPDDNANWGYAHGAAMSGKRAAKQIMDIATSSAANSMMTSVVFLVIPSLVVSFLCFS